MPKRLLLIDSFHGGLSRGEKTGIAGSFLWGQGLDYRTDPDSLTSLPALAADAEHSAGLIDGLPKWIISEGATNRWAYADNGDLYKRDATDWTLARAVASSHGQGLALFNDYLWYSLDAALGSYGPLSAPSFDDGVETLQATTTWAPLTAGANLLCAGNGRYVSTRDDSNVWVSDAVTLPPDYNVRCFGHVGEWLAIGATRGTNIYDYENGKVFFWDYTESNYNFYVNIPEGEPNALIGMENMLLIVAGGKGNMYLTGVNTTQMTPLRPIPNVALGKYVEVYPGAVSSWGGLPRIGISAGDCTTVERGVYSYGTRDKNYPRTLNFDYPISTGTTTGATLQIGAIHGAAPDEFYVGWKDGSDYGIDLIDTTTYQATTTLETRIFDFGLPHKTKRVTNFQLNFSPLSLAGQKIELKYKKDRAAAWVPLDDVNYTDDGAKKTVLFPVSGKPFRVAELQLQVILTPAAAAPELKSIVVEFEEVRALND